MPRRVPFPALLAVLAPLLAPLPGLAQEGPSFDCRLARSDTEIAICRSADLARLERAAVVAYERLVAALGRGPARAIADEQFARREACGADADCIARRLAISREVFLQRAGVEVQPPVLPPAPRAGSEGAGGGEPPIVLAAPAPPPWELPAPGGVLAPLPPGGLEAGPPAPAPPSAPAPQPEVAAAPDSVLGQGFMAWPDWRRRNLQGRLQEAGFHDGAVDGLWDAATEAALTAFVLDAAGRGIALDPRTQAGAAAVLLFVDGDRFRAEWLGERGPEVALDW